MSKKASGTLLALSLLIFGFAISKIDPRDPKAALATMKVPKGFLVQQFAAEPLVTNPTNLEVDERGRVWITESHNYDAAPDETDQKGDKVVILEDVNGDGKADKRTVFFEHPAMRAPMGLLLAEDRVFLAQAPNLLMLLDTNHDDKADRVDTLFTGFGARDHGIHAPFWGPDGKLYFSMGNNGGEVRDKNGKPVRDAAGNVVNGGGNPYRNGLILRCNPDGSQLETIAHNFRNQYEPAFDSFGNLWVTDNDDDGFQSVRLNYMMEYGNYGFGDEMTGAAWTTYRTNLEATVPEQHWHQNDPGVIPNVGITGSGSPAGLCIYEGKMLPPPFRNQPLHAEALHNVIRSYTTRKTGAGYKMTTQEILKSSDQWFRPVDVSVAPDGSVMAADWYDPGIGGGTAADAKKGRIYRLSYGGKSDYKFQKLSFNTPENAVNALQSPNWAARRKAWAKLTAFGNQAQKSLQNLYQSPDPVMQARALWLLAKIPETSTTFLTKSLHNKNPDIRITALRAARQSNPFPFALCAHLQNDPAPEVRREWAIALRFLKTPESAESWAGMAARHEAGGRWDLEALGIASDLHADTCFEAWLQKVGNEWDTPSGHDIIWRTRAEKALPILAELIMKTREIDKTLRYFRAFDFHRSSRKNETLESLLKDSRPEIQRLALEHMDGASISRTKSLDQALETALASAGQTISYVRLVEKFRLTDKSPQLMQLVECCAKEQAGVEAMQLLWRFDQRDFIANQIKNESTADAVMTALKGNGKPDALQLLANIMLDDTRPIELRKTATRVLGSSWSGEQALLDYVKNKSFPEQLKQTAGSVLFGAYRNEIKREAARYLPKPAGKSGEPLPPVYLLAYENGNAAAGKQVFSEFCQGCHRVGQTGVLFGPELSKIGSKLSKEGFFRAILYPDEGINHGYGTSVLTLADGGQLTGIIESETGDALILKLPGGLTQTIRKVDIKSKTAAPQSMMPPFGETLTQTQLVDLVQYLGTLK